MRLGTQHYKRGLTVYNSTEKDPGMFGTLVICLPSEHTGGTVCLQHGGKSLELSTAPTSAYGYYCLAWYTDVTHEVSYLLSSKTT